MGRRKRLTSWPWRKTCGNKDGADFIEYNRELEEKANNLGKKLAALRPTRSKVEASPGPADPQTKKSAKPKAAAARETQAKEKETTMGCVGFAQFEGAPHDRLRACYRDQTSKLTCNRLPPSISRNPCQ